MKRKVVWFSCGAASAVAAKIAVDEFRNESSPDYELLICSIYLKNEHPDSVRFLKDCEEWLGHKFTILKDEKYGADVDTVIEKTRYMSGVYGARCTKELKKNVRLNWQRDNDIHVFGMTFDEEHRIDRLIDQEPELDLDPILIRNKVTKKDCFKIIEDAGIEVPEMYKLGYNNNCIGCLKAGGAGYWNKIRKDFPEVFEKRSEQERLLNVAMVKYSAKKMEKYFPDKWGEIDAPKIDKQGMARIPLRFLPDQAGKHEPLYVGDCGFFCESSQQDMFS